MVMPVTGKESGPVPIKNDKFLPFTSISAGLGMAISYYSYPFFIKSASAINLLLFIFIVLIIFVCCLRTLCNIPVNNSFSLIIKISLLAGAAVIGFSLGIAARRVVNTNVEMGLPSGDVIAVSGILKEDPRSFAGGSGLGVLDLRECSGSGGLRASAKGRVNVFFPSEIIPRLKEFGRGTLIYSDGFISQGRMGLVFNASSVHIITPASKLETFRTGLRTFLIEKIMNRSGMSPPIWGGLASALLLGIRDDLETDLSDGFRDSGCSHILALSGMHLGILSGVLAFLLKRPLGKRWASLIGALFIIVYVFIAGSQPSLVRSAIMYLIGTFMLWGFLNTKPISLLFMAFIIQLIFQSDTGVSLSFILSYLALLGILTLGMDIWSIFRGRLPEIINGGLSASLGAFIITSPVVVLYFGTIRPIGIIAGLILAPISSLFMIFSLAALISGFLPLPIWNIFNWILSLLYNLIKFLISLARAAPGLSISNFFPVLVFCILFWAIILYLKKRDDLHRRSIASFG